MFPTAVVVDTLDGYTYWRGHEGRLLNPTTARAFASHYNDNGKLARLEDGDRFVVFTLTADKVS